MSRNRKSSVRRIVIVLGLLLLLLVGFTLYTNIRVENAAEGLGHDGNIDPIIANHEKIVIPDIMPQKSYSSTEGMIMRIAEPLAITPPLDSLIVEFTNSRDSAGLTGEWFRIEKLSGNGQWTELPFDRKYENKDGEIAIIFNAIGYPVSPDKPLRLTVKPWFYIKNWTPGTYRLVKTFSFPPYPIVKSDTAYVEFQIR